MFPNFLSTHPADKKFARAWVEKLKDCNARMADLQQRNTVMVNLCFQMTSGVLLSPFNAMPKFTELSQLGPFPKLDANKVLPNAEARLPKILQQSPGAAGEKIAF